MNEITLLLDNDVLALIGTTPTASAADKGAAIKAALGKLKNYASLEALLNTEKTAKEQAVKEFADYKTTQEANAITAKLEEAVAAGFITKATSDAYAKDYAGNLTGLEAVLKTHKPYKSITAQLGGGKATEDLSAKSWDELHRANKLVALKSENKELYDQKFEEKYGKKPRD